MIDKITIEQVWERASVLDVVSDYVQLTKYGSNYKACCPFHKERTASFVVSPSKNIWHCFGCGRGGNAIDFVMEHEGITYPEAIKLLCKKYGIQYREDEEKHSKEEEEEYKKKQSLFIITQAAANFYAAQIHENNPECVAALNYVNRRWNKRIVCTKTNKHNADDIEKDFPALMGIGYAKGWDSFYQYGTKKGYSEMLMEEAGLIKKSSKGDRYYDVFHERITIPIRDKYRNVIGFTCRSTDEDKRPPKYLNSSDSIIYHKRSSIFGIDNAVKQAIAERCFYCVEGAPDAMQLHALGIDNAIAALGTSWTPEIFAQLKKFNATLCFIPDTDLPKHGERFGAGFKAVMKAGKMAVENGFRVTVRQIPASEGKQDVDSFIQSKDTLLSLTEEDFVIWYCSKLIDEDDNTSERMDKIKEVCSIIAQIDDEFLQDSLIEQLGNRHNGKARWKAALKEVKRENERRIAEAKSSKGDIDLLKKYGFMEEDNCYWGENGKRQWSNFKMQPLFHIKDSFNAKRIYKMTNIYGRSELIELKIEEMISLPKFQQRIESLGNYLWMATMEELRKLKEYLYENTESAEEIKQMGWNKSGFYVWGNGIFFQKKFFKVDDYGIVRLERTDDEGHARQENYYLPAMSKIYADERELFSFERKFILNPSHSSISLPAFCEMMAGVFGDNAKIGVEFLLATLFRDIITSVTKNFPILNLFGPKGSGKSELAHTLEAFFIKDDTGINIQNATIAALADAIAQCSNALVHIDEYKNNVDPIKIEFLKGLYDGTGRSRMNMELDKKRQITAVDSAVVLSGQEMPTVDIALFSRTIYLTFESTTHTREQKQKFKELGTIRSMGVPHLTNEIVMQRDIVASQFYDTYNEVLTDLEKDNNGEIEDRIWRNWGMLLSVYKILKEPLKLPWSYEEMRELTSKGIKRQNQECSAGNELGAFWDMFEYMVNEGMIYPEGDYKIKYVDEIKTNLMERKYPKRVPILMMRPKHIILQYKKAARMTDERTMSEQSIRFYLMTSPGILGKKKTTERFKVIIDGQVQQKLIGKEPETRLKDLAQFDNPLCFEYRELQKTYGINLEREDDEIPEEKEEIIDKSEERASPGNLPF